MKSSQSRTSGLTLVEMLVAVAVLSLILIIVSQVVNGASGLLRRTQAGIDAFQETRAAFQQMISRLSQATLNPSWAYNFTSTGYSRTSSLQFVSGESASLASSVTGIQTLTQAAFFQAPTGFSANSTYVQKLPNTLNVCGYWIQYGSDAPYRPNFLAGSPVALRYRFRLMEMCQPTESFSVYQNPYPGWFTTPMTDSASTHVLAQNIVALIIQPQSSPYDGTSFTSTAGAPNYQYNSLSTATPAPPAYEVNQLPPMVQVTVVAIDEASAARLQAQSANPATAPTFGLSFDPSSGLFTNASNYQIDLQKLETALATQHLAYEVFTNIVSFPQAKWSP
jgi:uncharacterized protein (TIGR02599 family)